MATSKPKKGFSMSLSKPKSSSSSSAAAAKGGDRATSVGVSKPSAIGVAHDDDDGEDAGGGRRDYVTGIGGGKVVTKKVVVERGPRVIALASNPWTNNDPKIVGSTSGSSSKSSSSGSSSSGSAGPGTVSPADAAAAAAAAASATAADEPAPEKSLDQLAAEAIVRESRRGGGPGDGGATDGYGLGLDSDRVIGMVGSGGVAAAPAPAGATPTPGGKKKTGLLEQNMIPGLMDVDGEDAKFKHDLGHRADDLSVRSKAYVDVPVAEFGAALLRGMGWKGPEGESGAGKGSGGNGPDLSKDIEPRHHRLGLGAQPKPPEEMKKPRKRKPGEKPRASDAERLKMWEKKVQEERSRASQSGATKPLSVMDVVELSGRDGGGGNGRRPRAMVLKTQGVPGLNKISVRMEDTGEKVVVDKSSAVRVSEDDLARRPFSDKQRSGSSKSSKRTSSPGPDSPVEAERRKRSRSRSSSRDGRGSGSRRRRRREGEGGTSRAAANGSSTRKRSRSRSRSRSSSRGSAGDRSGDDRDRRKGGKKDKSSKKDKRKHKKTSGGGGGSSSSSSKRERSSVERPPGDKRGRREGESRDGGIDDDGGGCGGHSGGSNGYGVSNGGGSGQQAWLRSNIRVRVVHRAYAGAYLGKGRVVDVPRVGKATVRMDVGDLVLEGVKERHLETVLPSRGGKVVVVRGAERGATGKLLAKNKEAETALVQVYEDLRAITLSLDDVAEFTGALDEDLDDVGY